VDFVTPSYFKSNVVTKLTRKEPKIQISNKHSKWEDALLF